LTEEGIKLQEELKQLEIKGDEISQVTPEILKEK
jgi:hypothetical protein